MTQGRFNFIHIDKNAYKMALASLQAIDVYYE